MDKHEQTNSLPAISRAAPGGASSIEARLSLLHHFGVNSGRLSLSRWEDLCATAPAQLMGLARKGSLLPGYDADVVIFDPQREKTLSVDTLHEAADWAPYQAVAVTGWAAQHLAVLDRLGASYESLPAGGFA
jgi:dihydropyrimidinase